MTHNRCAYAPCAATLRPDGPSPWWCDDTCRQHWTQAQNRTKPLPALMSTDVTPERPTCPECAPGAANPHHEPDRPHVHLTSYGYLIYAPDREQRDFIEEIRAVERRAGREDAAKAIDDARAYPYIDVEKAKALARGQQLQPEPWQIRAAATGGGPCRTCGKPFYTHVCLSCSPDYQTPGKGCHNCRGTGMDQTPCRPPMSQAVRDQ